MENLEAETPCVKHTVSTTSIEPIQNIGTYHRRITSIINISPAIVIDRTL